jgi:hypothetical protein
MPYIESLFDVLKKKKEMKFERRLRMEKDLTFTATYDKDSRRYHGFLIDEAQEITGTIYIPKDMKVPDSVTIQLKTKEKS